MCSSEIPYSAWRKTADRGRLADHRREAETTEDPTDVSIHDNASEQKVGATVHLAISSE